MAKDWIKLWTKEWLFGSSRRELTPSERAIWIDLLVLAGIYDKEGKTNGVIEVDIDSLPRLLNVRSDVLHVALTKFSLSSDPNNEPKIKINGKQITIVNWGKYNPTRLEVFREKQKHSETPRNGVKQDETLETEGETETELEYITSSIWYKRFRKDYHSFKDSDLDAAYEFIIDWNKKHPKKQRSFNKRFLINWAKRDHGTNKRDLKAGRVPEKYTPAEEL